MPVGKVMINRNTDIVSPRVNAALTAIPKTVFS